MKALFNDIRDAAAVVKARAKVRAEEADHEKALRAIERKIELEEYERELRAEIEARRKSKK